MKKTKTNFSTLLHRSLQKLSFIFMIVLRLKENQKVYNIHNYNLEISIKTIEEGILETKTKCYAKDKVKSPPFF